MAKKSIDDNLLTGGSLSESSKSKKSKKTNAKSKKGIAKNTAKMIKSCICVVLVIALIAGYFFTGIARKGVVSNLGIPAKTLTAATVSNGDQKETIKVGTYNFYFFTVYNNMYQQFTQLQGYGVDPSQFGLDVDLSKSLDSQTYVDEETGEEMSWAKHMQDMVFDTIEDVYAFYIEACQANGGEEPAITEDQQAQIDSTMEEYRQSAYKADYDLSPYLTRVMGKGVNEALVREEMKRQFISTDYKNSLTVDTTDNEYSFDDILAYVNDNAETYQTVDIMEFECANEDDAIAFKNALKADGSNFGELASQYSTGDIQKLLCADPSYSTMMGMKKNTLGSYSFAFVKDKDGAGLDWLFSADRKAGDIYQYSTSVVYVLSPASVADRNYASVRHILISPDMGDDAQLDASGRPDYTKATPAQWAEAYSKAESILNEWKNGEATEDSFVALVADNTDDEGSASTGGLYADLALNGQYANSFGAWAYAPGRQVGDTAIVPSIFGYHIMYYVETCDEKIWQPDAEKAILTDDANVKTDAVLENYTVSSNWFATSFYCQKDVDISR